MRDYLIAKFLAWAAPFVGIAFLLVIFVGGLCAAFTNAQGSGNKTGADTTITAQGGDVSGLPISNQLIAFIESWEGFHSTAYQGEDFWNYTIGYGHVEQPGDNFTALTQQQAEQLLITDLKSQGYIQSVQEAFKGVNLTQNQFDALVDLSYNLGANIWSRISLTGDIKSNAGHDILKADFERLDTVAGTQSPGLLRRRDAEYTMFTSNAYLKN